MGFTFRNVKELFARLISFYVFQFPKARKTDFLRFLV